MKAMFKAAFAAAFASLAITGLVDAAHYAMCLLLVTDAFGQGEGRRDHIEQAEGEERADPAAGRQVHDGDAGGQQRDPE